MERVNELYKKNKCMKSSKQLISKKENELLKIVIPVNTCKYGYLLVTQRNVLKWRGCRGKKSIIMSRKEYIEAMC